MLGGWRVARGDKPLRRTYSFTSTHFSGALMCDVRAFSRRRSIDVRDDRFRGATRDLTLRRADQVDVRDLVEDVAGECVKKNRQKNRHRVIFDMSEIRTGSTSSCGSHRVRVARLVSASLRRCESSSVGQQSCRRRGRFARSLRVQALGTSTSPCRHVHESLSARPTWDVCPSLLDRQARGRRILISTPIGRGAVLFG